MVDIVQMFVIHAFDEAGRVEPAMSAITVEMLDRPVRLRDARVPAERWPDRKSVV